MTPSIRPPVLGGGAGATPGVLMFIGGLALVYWALSGWNLFGLGSGESGKRVFGGGAPFSQMVPGLKQPQLPTSGRKAGGAGGGKVL